MKNKFHIKHKQKMKVKFPFKKQKQITHQIIFSHEKILQKIEFHEEKRI